MRRCLERCVARSDSGEVQNARASMESKANGDGRWGDGQFALIAHPPPLRMASHQGIVSPSLPEWRGRTPTRGVRGNRAHLRQAGFRRIARRWLLGAAIVVTVALGLACQDEDEDATVSATPGGQQVVTEGAPLHEARLDAAKRAGVRTEEVSLRSLRAAGFDGCLGVAAPGQACTQQFIGGFVAVYEADEAEYRYHFGGRRFVYADPALQVTDGSPTPPEIEPDLDRELAAYARADLGLRAAGNGGARVTAIIPLTFPTGCMGFLPDGQDVCTDAEVDGAVVFLLGADAKTYRYHVGANGVIATDFVKGRITFEPNAAARVSEQLLRDDLALRLNVAVAEIEVVSYRLVAWPDGCVGVYRQEAVCAQALVEGFLALLRGPDGKEYRYHGGPTGGFIAASFEPNARIAEPLPRQ